MPIKLPKGFQRRKSSGNALDEVNGASAPGTGSSFRVIERPRLNKSYDGNLAIRSAASAGLGPPLAQCNSFEPDQDDLFSVARPDAGDRSSGGTETSNPASQHPSGASSSRRSTSTNPSSIDSHSDRFGQPKDVPAPPPPSARPGFLRTSTHTFSLTRGLKSSKDSNTAAVVPASGRTLPPAGESSRSRAMTTSSASTATPPKLFDSEFGLDSVELDGFGNMFDGIGTHSSREQSPSRRPPPPQNDSSYAAACSPSYSSPAQRSKYPPSSFPAVSNLQPAQNQTPSPARPMTTAGLDSSPYYSSSQDSHDSLMRSPSPSRTITQASPSRGPRVPDTGSSSIASSAAAAAAAAAPAASQTPRLVSSSQDDNDDDLPPPVPRHTSISNGYHKPPQQSGSAAQANGNNGNHNTNSQDHDVDPSLAATAALWSRFDTAKPSEGPLPPKGGPNKVMTHAQFERYKQQQELDRRVGASSDPDEDEADAYEDDDFEAEKEKQASKQRKKQEAHLAVYRQQMMKVTGEHADPAPRPTNSSSTNLLRANSTPELSNRLSNTTTTTKDSSRSSAAEAEEDEDEDVPLGILAAHGFPNKNRPPTQLSQSTSNPNLRSLAQIQGGAGSSLAGPDAAKRGSLPVFARNLPQDPYFGASIVNPVNREPLAMHAAQVPVPMGTPGPGTPGPVPMGTSGPATAHPLHPAGLVGVIAGEEKARALRRGGVSAHPSAYDLPPSMQNPVFGRAGPTLPPSMMPPQMMGGMPAMMSPPVLSPGDQAQMQMNQHVTQMMQMQLQWMQQMTNMMGSQMNQGQQPPAPMSPSLAPVGGQPSRPQSAMPAPFGQPPAFGPQPAFGQQRTMSTLTPSMSNWNLPGPNNSNSNNNYAPSLAPSERSNVGLASRYRPVSTVQDADSNTRRASTFTSATLGAWSGLNPSSNPRPLSQVNTTIRPVTGNAVGRKSPLAQVDDDDDEQAWAEMKAKKETKQKSWKLRKGNNVLQELYNGVS